MRIQHTQKAAFLCDIPLGQVFEWCGELYMKVDTSVTTEDSIATICCVVNISTGYCERVDIGMAVRLVTGAFVEGA